MKNNSFPPEPWEQQQVFNWKHNNLKKYPVLKYLNGSMNGVPMSKGLRIQMIKHGLIKGVPDIDLPAKNKTYSGLHIELKILKGGVASKEQKDFLLFLLDQGRLAVICEGHAAAIKVITEYLEDM